MRRAAVIALVVSSVALGAAGAVAAALWLFPGSLLTVAARAARPHGVDLAAASVDGTPGLGWTIHGLTVRAAAFDVEAQKVRLNVNWRSTLTGRPALDALWVEGLRAEVRPSTASAASRSPAAPPSLVPIHDLRVTASAVAVAKPDADPFVVDGIELQASLVADAVDVAALAATVNGTRVTARGAYDVPGGKLTIDRVAAAVSGSTVTGRGTFTVAPFAGTFHADVRGPMEISADFEGTEKRWTLTAVGERKASRLNARATMDFATDAWSADVTLAGVPANVVPGLPPTLGALSGTLVAAGRGRTPETMNGRGRVAVEATNGPRVEGDVAIKGGEARAALAVSSGGIDGAAHTRWSFAKNAGVANVDFRLNARGLRRWLPAGADGAVRAGVTGPKAALAWKLDATLSRVEGPVVMKSLRLRGAGRSLAPPEGKLSVEAAGAEVGAQVIEKAAVLVDGRPERHAFELTVARDGAGLSAAGSGSLASGVWQSTWTRVDADLGRPWRLDAPFRLVAGPGRVFVHGLRLVSERGGSLRLDGGVRAGRFEALRLAVAGLQLDGIAKLAGAVVPVAGVAAFTVNAAGPLRAPDASVKGRVVGLSIDGRPAGDLALTARTGQGRVVVERAELQTVGGRLTASADLPMSAAGKKIPPFTIRIQTAGLDLAALPIPMGDITFEKALLKADLGIAGRGGRFSADGTLELAADRIGETSKKGLAFNDVRLRLAGDGASLRVVEAVARGGNGRATLAGRVTPTKADLAFVAREFEVRHSAGLFVRFDAALALKGAWAAPHLDGKVDISKGEMNPSKAEKDDPKKDGPETPVAPDRGGSSPLSMNVNIGFDRDVWYRDGQSAIELKGDLEVRKESGGGALMFGSVQTIRGDYYFYGRAFAIEDGRLIFAGEAPVDPRLQLRAMHHNTANNVKIWIDATGKLSDPRIALSSQPPMEETDIISVLVTGSPMGTERSGGSDAVARSMAANYLAEKVRQQVQNTIPIDVLKVELREGGSGDVTIGDRVTEDLYVSYGQTLGSDAERRVNAEYELSPRFSLHGATSSVGRYVLDLLFRFGFY